MTQGIDLSDAVALIAANMGNMLAIGMITTFMALSFVAPIGTVIRGYEIRAHAISTERDTCKYWHLIGNPWPAARRQVMWPIIASVAAYWGLYYGLGKFVTSATL